MFKTQISIRIFNSRFSHVHTTEYLSLCTFPSCLNFSADVEFWIFIELFYVKILRSLVETVEILQTERSRLGILATCYQNKMVLKNRGFIWQAKHGSLEVCTVDQSTIEFLAFLVAAFFQREGSVLCEHPARSRAQFQQAKQRVSIIAWNSISLLNYVLVGCFL